MSGFLFVDQITELNPGTTTRGIKVVSNQDVYCMQVDDAAPAFWPALIGETLGQLCAWNVMYTTDFQKRPVAGVSKSAILHDYARMGDTIQLLSEIESLDDQAVVYSSKAWVNDHLIFELNHALGPLLPMTDFINESVVRQQFAKIFQDVATPSPIDQSVQWVVEEYDRVISCDPGESMLAEKVADEKAPYFSDHFPNKPVLPLTVLLQCHVSLARSFLQASMPTRDLTKLKVIGFSKIKMGRFVQPGDRIETRVSMIAQDDHHAELEFSTFFAQRRICTARAEFIF